jgi:tetratricopeptide (TPR) repeat protein
LLAECFGVRGMTEARREVQLALSGRSSGKYFLTLGKHLAAPGALTWSGGDQLAVNHLHLGQPESARRIWNEATAAPSAALRLTRLAGVDLAALDASSAAARSQAALDLDPTLGEAWYVLAIAALDCGRAQAALDASREGLKHELTPAQHEALAGVERLLSRSSAVSHE